MLESFTLDILNGINMSFKILTVIGTRPEAIKLAPVIDELKNFPNIENKIFITGQHQELLHSVLQLFHIHPDYELNVMSPNQDLANLTTKIILGLNDYLKSNTIDLLIVHGDTTTCFAASLSAFYHKIPVVHVEAGLRTGNVNFPWPEEANRKLTSSLTAIHFAPTETARINLLQEGVSPNHIFVTGNTVIDALLKISQRIETDLDLQDFLHEKFNFLDKRRKMILVTGHRRENYGEGFLNICQALKNIAMQYPHVDIVYPVHLNPNVQGPVFDLLANTANIYLLEPLDYLSFVFLMKNSYFILTDSGGVQEEAPSLRKPVLVMRNNTERPEVMFMGAVKLVGTNSQKIYEEVSTLLNDEEIYRNMQNCHNPYGDGKAAKKIVKHILEHLESLVEV